MEGSSQAKGLRKGAWTAEEDSLLRQCIDKYGEGKWHKVPLRAAINRCRKSCRLRWLNYLKPSIKRGKFSSDEVDLLLRLHKLLGNRWSLIAGRLPGRTANDVKNYWNTHLSKKHEPLSCKKHEPSSCKNHEPSSCKKHEPSSCKNHEPSSCKKLEPSSCKKHEPSSCKKLEPSSCKTTKMKKRNISFSPTTSVRKIDVLKPRPRSFSVNNGCSRLNGLQEVEVNPPCLGLNNNNVCENIITCNKDELVNNLMDGDNMWWENLLEESQETENGATSAFDVDQLWNMFDGETLELD